MHYWLPHFQVWFQNRRAKFRRNERSAMSSSVSSSTTSKIAFDNNNHANRAGCSSPSSPTPRVINFSFCITSYKLLFCALQSATCRHNLFRFVHLTRTDTFFCSCLTDLVEVLYLLNWWMSSLLNRQSIPVEGVSIRWSQPLQVKLMK